MTAPTITVTAADILREARAYARNPDHIVRNPHHLFETKSGEPTMFVSEAACGCLLGLTSIAARRLGLDAPGRLEYDVDSVVASVVQDRGYQNVDFVIAAGHHEVLSVLDEALDRMERAA